jgi:hypothetical protein
MVDVLENNLRPEAKAVIDYREWSIKTREGVQIFTERGGRVIPTLCINGVKVFESVIPTIDELYEALVAGARDEAQAATLRAAWRRAAEEYEGT